MEKSGVMIPSSQLSEMTGISQTQLSDYENGNKTPGLPTLAKISTALKKSMDDLCFGDASVSFIASAPDKGRLIANCVYQLWEQGVIHRHVPSEVEERYGSSYYTKLVADLHNYDSAVERLLVMLDDFSRRKHTYKDPDSYLEQMLDSTAREICPRQSNRASDARLLLALILNVQGVVRVGHM